MNFVRPALGNVPPARGGGGGKARGMLEQQAGACVRGGFAPPCGSFSVSRRTGSKGPEGEPAAGRPSTWRGATRPGSRFAFGVKGMLWHAFCLSLLIALSCLLFYRSFYQSGVLMHVDMTYPTELGRNFALYTNTWWQYGSVTNVWNIQRVFWAYPMLVAARMLHLSVSGYLLATFLGTFALAGVSMYALVFRLLRRMRGLEEPRFYLYAAAVTAALIYMYNPWSLSHMWTYFGYPAYAVLPLVFMVLVLAVESGRFRYTVLLAVLLSLASTGPICVFWLWLLVFFYLLYTVAAEKFSRESLKAALSVMLPALGMYILMNALWMLPYLESRFSHRPFVPVYMRAMSRSMLDALSSRNSLANSLRLISGWGMPVDPAGFSLPWRALFYAAPVLAAAGLLAARRWTRKNKYIRFWTAAAAVSIVLSTGTNWVLRGAYSYMVMRAPVISSIGWVFRAADRWLFYVPLFYALMIGLLAGRLLENETWPRLAAFSLAAVLLGLSFFPLARAYADRVYNPTRIPQDYAEVERRISAGGGKRATWIPFFRDGFHYWWEPDKRLGAFAVISGKPSLNNFSDPFKKESLFYWLENIFSGTLPGQVHLVDRERALRRDLAARLLIPFSAEYLVYDTSVPGYRVSDSFKGDASMDEVADTGYLRLYRLDYHAPMVRAAGKTIAYACLDDYLSISQALPPGALREVGFTESGSKVGREYGLLDPADYLEPSDINGGFEGLERGGEVPGWTPFAVRGQFRLGTDSPPGTTGERALKLENGNPRRPAAGKVIGEAVPVGGGEVYFVESRVKFRNAAWTSTVVEGRDTATGEWFPMIQMPALEKGTSDWRRYRTSLYVPRGVDAIRCVLAAGWTQAEGKEGGASWFDEVKLSKLGERFFREIAGTSQLPRLSFRRESAQCWDITVRGAEGPFLVVFGESFDPSWVLTTDDGERVEPVSLYGTITGFPVNIKGDVRARIEYRPQKWFRIGLFVSVSWLLICLGYLAARFAIRVMIPV